MPTLNQFASYDSIRAALGVSDDEVADTVLGLPIYMQLLNISFDAVVAGISDVYLPLVTGNPPPVLTPVQQRFVDVVQLFSVYSTAKTLLTSLPMFSPLGITDGRATLTRFDTASADIRQGVDLMFGVVRQKVLDAWHDMGMTPPDPVSNLLFNKVGLATSPVTNV